MQVALINSIAKVAPMAKRATLEQWQIEDAARLKELFAKKAQLNQSEFGARYDIGNQGYVWQLLNGWRPLNIDAAQKFAKGLGCSIDEFSPTIAAKIAEASGRIATNDPAEIDPKEDPNFAAIRQVVFKISAGLAGFSVEFTDEDSEEPLFLPRGWLERRDLDPSKLYATRVNGSSMAPGIRDGDVIVVDTSNTSREKDAIVAVNHEGELTVKRLKYEHRRWWLTSDNADQKSYPPVPCGDGTYLLGRVVHLHREL